MRLVLVRKFANQIDGIDLTRVHVGDVLELSRADARLLEAEGWGVIERRTAQRRLTHGSPVSMASDRKRRLRRR